VVPPTASADGTWCQAVVEATPDGILVSDESGAVAYLNPQLEQMSGYSRAELLGRPVEVLVPLEARQRHAALHEAYRGAPAARLMGLGRDLMLRRRDGSTLAVEIALAPLVQNGRSMTVTAVRDITVRRELEAERNRLLEVLDLVPDAVLVVNASTLAVEYANRALSALVGYAADELVGGSIGRLRPEATDAERHAVIGGLSRVDVTAQYVDLVLRTRSGEPVPVETHQRLVTDADGARHVVAVARDLRERLEREEQLRASEASFRTAFEQAPVGVEVVALSATGERVILMANQAMADMFGCSVADLVGHDIDEYTSPEEQAQDRAAGVDLASGIVQQVSRLKRYTRPDGQSFWADARATRLELPDQPGPLALIHLVDVSERVAQQEREAAEATLGTCVAEVATAVLGDAPESEVLERIADGATRLLQGDGALLMLHGSGSEERLHLGAAAGVVAPLLRNGSDHEGLADWLTRDRTVPREAPDARARTLVDAWGPAAVAPFGGTANGPRGLLAVVRGSGAPPFLADDVDRLTRLAAQTDLAVRLARARTDQYRLALLEERQRIARDLHDTVTQDVIGVGMQISAEVVSDDPERRQRDLDKVVQLEEAVRRLRRIVFELRTSPPWARFSQAVRDLTSEASRLLGHEPELALTGPVDFLPTAVAADVLSVLREALSNIARHARATHTRVAMRVTDDEVELVVEDDGRGIPASAERGYGISNIEHRATARGGSATLRTRAHGGSRLVWSCPIPPQPRSAPR